MMTEGRPGKLRSPARSVALPAEHGGWGFVLEPILLGLLVAPSWAGFFLGIVSFMLFMLHQPLKVLLKDRVKGRWSVRTTWAIRFVLGYGTALVLSFGLALWLAEDGLYWLPLLLTGAMLAVLLVYDLRNQSRMMIAELLGGSAPGGFAVSIAVLGGFEIDKAWVLWAILIGRGIPSILYIRARLRLDRDKAFSKQLVWAIHIMSIAGIVALIAMDLAPWLVLVVLVILFGRMAMGLSAYRKPHPVKVIGFMELGYGVMTVVLTAVGYGLFAG